MWPQLLAVTKLLKEISEGVWLLGFEKTLLQDICYVFNWTVSGRTLQEAQQRQSAGPEGPGLSQPLQQSQAVQGGQDMSQSWVFMICTFLFFFSGIPLVLVRALVFSALVVLLHCTLRQTPCEFKEALGAAGQKGGMRPAGVPFLEVGFLAIQNGD